MSGYEWFSCFGTCRRQRTKGVLHFVSDRLKSMRIVVMELW
jgi:hypothetical protein